MKDFVDESVCSKHEDTDQISPHSRPFYHPEHRFHRFCLLIFMCFLGFGNAFCMDTVGSLSVQIKDSMHVTTAQIMLLYTFDQLPSVFLTIINGYIVDRYLGFAWGAIICCCLTVIGQITLGLATLSHTFMLMLVGRFIYGIGSATLDVTESMRAVKFFGGTQLSMVFGLQLSIQRLGSSLTFVVMEFVYDWVAETQYTKGTKAIGIAILIAAEMVILDLLNSIFLMLRDRWAEKKLKNCKIKKEVEKTKDEINLSEIFQFPLSYWMIAFIILFYFSSVFSFIAIAKPFYQQKYDFSSKSAAAVSSVIYITSGVLCPFLGLMIGHYGYDICWLLLAAILSWIAHAILAFTLITPWFAVILLGVGYSIFTCTVWAMISFIIPERKLGTAYGLSYSALNLGMAIFGYLAGVIVDKSDYFFMEIFFLSILSCAIILIALLFKIDHSNGSILNTTPIGRLKHNEK